MRKLFAILGMLSLMVFGLTIGASAADTPTRTSYLDLSAESVENRTEGWTWKVDGSKGTLTLNNLYLQAPSLVNGQVKDMVAFPGGVTDIQIVLQGSNIIHKTDTWQCDIFAAAGKKVTISGDGSLEFRSADKNSTLVNCDSLTMESGTISMADDCGAGYLFHTQNGLAITGGSMTFKSTYGIRSEKGPVSISGGNINLTMTNPGYGIYAGPNLAADTDEVASPAITISGGTITTNGSISDAWFKGLSIAGGSIRADKEVRGNLFYAAPDNKVTLPDGFSTEQLSTTNSYILEVPSGGILEVPARVRVYTNHLMNEGELDNRGRVTVRNSYKGEGMISGGGLIDFTSSYWTAVNSHAQNAVLNRSVTNSIDETGYCYVYGNAAWNSGWGYTPKTMYIPKGGKLTVPSGATATVSGAITIHGADSLTGEGTVASTAGKYYIEYSEDSLTPAAEMDLTYDGTNLRNEVEQQAKKSTPDTTILNQTFVLGGDNLIIGYPYGSSSACPAGEGGNRYIEFNYDVATFPYHRISYRHYFSVKKLQITDATTLGKTVNLNTPYTGSPVNFPETYLKVTHNGKQIIINGNFDISYSNNVEAGDNAVITLTGKNNVEGTLTLNYTISPKTVANPVIELSPDTFVYDGAPKKPAVTVKDGGTVIPDSEYEVAYSNNTNVGTATVTITDTDGGNYTVSGTTTFPITKANPAPLTITGAPGSATYGDTFQLGLSGGSGTGAVSWAASGATVDNAGNVTVTSAGTVIITAAKAGDNNYSGTEAQIILNVSKKALTVTGATATSRKYNGANTVAVTAVALSGKVGSDDVSVSTANLSGTLNGSNVGSYTAVTLPALTLTGAAKDNYALTQPTGAVSTSVTISKADALTPKTGDLAVANKQAHTYTFGLGALRPDLQGNMSFGSGAVTYELGEVSLGSYYTKDAAIDGQTLTVPIEAVDNDKAEEIGTITVIIHTGSFEDMTATINVRSVNKTIPTGAPALSAATLTYGQPISTITLSGSMTDGEKSVPGIFEWSSPENRPAVQESYAAAWVFTPDDNQTYAIVNGTSAVKVLPASIASAVIVLKPTAFKYDGAVHTPAVESVKLGDATLTADTDYTVAIPSETAAGTYTVTLTGTGNYTGTAAATFAINPVETGDEFEDESGVVLRLEVETGLSTVPAALENDARYDTPKKIEAALRTQVEQVMSNVGENIALFDATLQYKDERGTWHTVDPNDFPAEGVTAILPYPTGSGANGYTFTVQHLISSGINAGQMETLTYELTTDGLKCKFSSLSPVAIGYKKNASSGGGSDSSGGGWVSYYSVKVQDSEHGKIISDRTSIYAGGTVTLTVQPDEGYKLDKITVTDSQNKDVELTEKNGKYTFKIPSRDVTVKADFVPAGSPSPEPTGSPSPSPSGSPTPTTSPSPSPKPWKNPFPDVSDTGWYIKAVEFVCKNGLMAGYENGRFGPNDSLTRAQFAQIIYSKAGRPKAGSGVFSDVTTGWYANAVNWAAAEGIVTGVGGGRFAPDRPITRQDLAVMLWRYAGSPEPHRNELDFKDAGKASTYAWKALCWANENGIVSGKGNGILDPKGKAARAEAAQMLMNYLKT